LNTREHRRAFADRSFQIYGIVIATHALLTHTYSIVESEPPVLVKIAPVGHEPDGVVLPVAHTGDGFGDGFVDDAPLVTGLVVKRECPFWAPSPRA